MNLRPKEMLVVSPPYELFFLGPFNRPCITELKLTNPSDQMMLFKIKTTAPKRYCVRPNFGAIAPGESSMVEICLQPFNYDPNEKNKHKFMVQAMVAPKPDATEDINKLWKDAEQSGQLMDVKLKCVFEMPPNEQSATEKSVSESGMEKDAVMFAKPKNVRDEEKADLLSGVNPNTNKNYLEEELNSLKEENNELRGSNILLTEKVARLSAALKVNKVANEPYTPQLTENQIPMFYIAVAIFAAIFGLVLGKFIL